MQPAFVRSPLSLAVQETSAPAISKNWKMEKRYRVKENNWNILKVKLALLARIYC